MSACTHQPFESFGAAMRAVRLAKKNRGARMRAKWCRCGHWKIVRAKPSPVLGSQVKPPYRNRSRRAA